MHFIYLQIVHILNFKHNTYTKNVAKWGNLKDGIERDHRYGVICLESIKKDHF